VSHNERVVVNVSTTSLPHPSHVDWIVAGEAGPIEEEDLLEFRLLYQGELLPSGNNNTRPAEKHAIRRSLHPQLRRLWHVHPSLREWARRVGAIRKQKVDPHPVLMEQEAIDFGVAAMSKQWERVGYDFIPLVTPAYAVRCSLEILLLRPEEDRFILRQGDIDGQVKTLFDALRIPKSLNEAGGIGPQEDETPFFVLLEDDRLISEVRVISDQLLLLPNNRAVKPNDCFATIHVKLNYKSWSRDSQRWLD
jgi:hypothetical protein